MKIEKINQVYRQNVPNRSKTEDARVYSSDKNNFELSKVYYKPLAFGKKLEEHNSWGARINPKTNELSFKIFTFPDAKEVYALIYKEDEKDIKEKIKLENKGDGVFESDSIPKDKVKEGDKYLFEIHKNNDEIEIVKDPYTFKQEKINGASSVYNQSSYKWQSDNTWKNNPNRITRKSDGKDGNRSLREARIFALNPDTFTDKRSYEGVIPKLKEIKANGFNTVEIMHVENTYSFNWGYDGVDKMAPSNYLGGPDKLKELVDEAHKEGLNVVFDIIPNHLGPDGAQLGRTGPYIKGPNDFGEAFNFEGENSEFVRDYIINSAMNWVENYHVDGLRLDMTKYMQSDNTLKQLASEINYHYPDCFLIAEDGRGGVSVDDVGNYWQNEDEVHDKRVTNKLKPEEYGEGEDEETHTKKIEEIIKDKGNLSRLGMDSEWDFNFYHQLDSSLYTINTSNLIKGAINAQDSVKYLASHDEIGNYEGTRKLAKLMVPKLMLNENVVLGDEDYKRASEYAKTKNKSIEEATNIIRCQKAQFVAEELAIKFQKGELDKYELKPSMTHEESRKLRECFKGEVLRPLDINPDVRMSFSKIKTAFYRSYNQIKMASALVYSIPGPKMVFQGDENADLTPFRFFRRFESVPYEGYLYMEKGYEPAEPALAASTIGKIKYSPDGKKRMDGFNLLMKDLAKLNEENPALRLGHINKDFVVDHSMSNLVAFDIKDKNSDNEIFTVSNLGVANYREDKDNEYYITFPEGEWIEVLNTDDIKYQGTSRHANKDEIIQGDGHSIKPINIGGYSTIYFKKVG